MTSELEILGVDFSSGSDEEAPNPLTNMDDADEREYVAALRDVIDAQRAGAEGSSSVLVH